MASKTSTKVRTDILADVWMNHRNDETLSEFIEYSDLGLPLAYSIANDIVETTPNAENFINETFEGLLEVFGVEEDAGYDDLKELLQLKDSDYQIPIRYIEEDDWQDNPEEEEEEDLPQRDSFTVGYEAGVVAERDRTQDIVKMHMRWAEQKNDGRDYMFWKGVGEVLTPIEPMTDEQWKEELEKDGF